MKTKIVHALEPILLVGGGKHRGRALKLVNERARRIIAADGGADWLLGEGIMPELVIGDLDSVTEAGRAKLGAARLHEVDLQDNTDFEKCLEGIDAPMIFAAGFLGGRADHELAAYHALLANAYQRCVVIGEEDVICLVPPALALDVPKGSRVSLFPMADVVASSEGLRWELEDLRLAPGEKIGTSNAALGPVRVTADAPCLLLILPHAAFGALCEALLEAPSWAD